MQNNWRSLLADLSRPSPKDETPYKRLLTAVGHGVAGAAVASLGAISLPWALALGLLYWVVKETGDLRQGGDFADGWIDAAFVVFGLLYTGQDWWPLALLGAATLDGLLRGKA